MNQASFYQQHNNMQRHDAKQILQEYAKIIQWRPDGRDTLLDVGCGSGNVLMDFVYPLLPESFEELVGTDVSAQMVGYARKCYDSYQRTKFKVLDIGGELVPKELCEKFDHVTSFYCLHWVQNQKRALENIYNLLRRDGGDCLLVFLAVNPIFDVYKTLAKQSKWSTYMQDVDNFISPLHFSKDPSLEYRQLLQQAGFTDYTVDIRNEVYVYEGVENLKNNVRAICPFLERIPTEQHDEFLNDFLNIVVSMNLQELDVTGKENKFKSPYKLLVVYARKSDGFLNNVLGDEPGSVKGLK